MRQLGASAFLAAMSRLSLALTLLLFTWDSTIAAQATYPTRPVRIVLGYGPGTSPDVAIRVFADKLLEKWGEPVVIENAIGASGNIAGQRVARAEPDGHTLLFAASSGIVINPSIYRKMIYDPVKD